MEKGIYGVGGGVYRGNCLKRGGTWTVCRCKGGRLDKKDRVVFSRCGGGGGGGVIPQCTLWSFKHFTAPLHRWGSMAQGYGSHYKKSLYFLSPSPQEVLVLTWLISEGWKAELTFEPPSSFELRSPGSEF